MKWYPWLWSHFCSLITNYKIGRWHHALLIQALPGIGSNSLIYAINRFLMCQQPTKYKSCGTCRGCQLMLAQSHPDYYVCKLEHGKTTIGVETVRIINQRVYEHARLGGAKVLWLKDISQFTEAAMNALLKTLEEPPKKTFFLFSCQNYKKLPMTLRSRCCLYRLKIPNEKLAINWLKSKITISSDELLAALRLCNGAPISALAQLQPTIWKERQNLCYTLNNILIRGNWIDLFNVLNNEKIIQQLYWLASLFLDAIKLQQGATLINNVDVLSLINKIANCILDNKIQAIVYAIFKAHQKLLKVSGFNREILLINLLLRIHNFQ